MPTFKLSVLFGSPDPDEEKFKKSVQVVSHEVTAKNAEEALLNYDPHQFLPAGMEVINWYVFPKERGWHKVT